MRNNHHKHPRAFRYLYDLEGALRDIALAEEQLAAARRERDRALTLYYRSSSVSLAELAATAGLSVSNVQAAMRRFDESP